MVSLIGKLELLSGILVGLLEVSLPLVLLIGNYDSQDASYTSAEIFELVTLATFHYLLPGLLVAIGSYVQVIKRHGAGVLCVIGGTIAIITFFFKSLFVMAILINHRGFKDPFILLNYSVPVLALVVLILSFIVAFQRRDSRTSREP